MSLLKFYMDVTLPISFFLEKNYMKAVKPSKILHGPGGATLPYNPRVVVPAAGLYLKKNKN
jgi:hypothetical protein